MQPTEPPFDSDAFVTKTYLTTYTYLTTLMQDGKPLVTSSERVVSNVATEYADAAADAEPTTGVVVPTEAPALATSVLRTTYTYLTVGNEEKSERVVLNTVTAPPDVFQRQPAPPVTNTYLTTVGLLTLSLFTDVPTLSSLEIILFGCSILLFLRFSLFIYCNFTVYSIADITGKIIKKAFYM